MTTDQVITVITGLLQGGGIIAFLYFLIGGLKNKISALKSTIDVQSVTLDLMDKRIEETKGIGQLYKDLLNEMPEDLKKYKDFIRESKDAIIEELKVTISDNNLIHKEELEKHLDRIHEQEKSINQLSKARESIINADEAIRSGMESISSYYEKEKIGNAKEFRSIEIYIQHKGELNIASRRVDKMKLISSKADASDGKYQNIDVEDIGDIVEEEIF